MNQSTEGHIKEEKNELNVDNFRAKIVLFPCKTKKINFMNK